MRVVCVDCGQLTDCESYRFVPVAPLNFSKLTVKVIGVDCSQLSLKATVCTSCLVELQ